MIEPTGAVAAATRTATTGGASAARTPSAKTSTSFAGELARASSTPSTTTKAAQRPDGEKTQKVDGHRYARIVNGTDKGLYLNQLPGSPRLGSAFKLVERDERVFHVYGAGADRVIVEVKANGKSGSTSAQSTGGATPATT